MTALLWEKGNSQTSARLMRFLSGNDVILDRSLFRYDLRATKAHVHGLARINVLSDHDARALTNALDALDTEFQAEVFVLDDRFEDGHSAIEAYVTAKLGPLGKRVHTGRSRNDQVQVALRMYMLDAVSAVEESCFKIAESCLRRAEAQELVPMPGYTHLQRAVPSSLGMWFSAFAEAFLDNAANARTTHGWLNSCPLGTAAGYGVNLPLDRDGVATELGFPRIQLNPIYVQNSRGKFELSALSALGQALLDVRRLAWDLSLFTSQEFDFVTLPETYTTGSSLMPNKRNPDVIELLRATYGVVSGSVSEIESILSLPSGYHRDLQATKEPLLRAFSRGIDALQIVPELVLAMQFKEGRMRAAITPEMYATDRAIEQAVLGVPFRDAYIAAAKEVPSAERSPEESLSTRTSKGAGSALSLDILWKRLEGMRKL